MGRSAPLTENRLARRLPDEPSLWMQTRRYRPAGRATPYQTIPNSCMRPRIHSRLSGATWRIGERITPPAMPSAS